MRRQEIAAWRERAPRSLVVTAAQAVLMSRFLRDPVRLATWYSGFGVTLYVLGMLASAIAVRGLAS